MENDIPFEMIIDTFDPVKRKGRGSVSDAEIIAARRAARHERLALRLAKAAKRQAMLNAGHVFPVRRTANEKRKATRARNRKIAVRANSMRIRRQLRLERLLRLALNPPRPPIPTGRYSRPGRISTAERAAKQRERDWVREEKRAARRAASRLPPLPY